MAAKSKVTKEDLKKNKKRVNITLDIKMFDLLCVIAESKNTNHTTIAKMLLCPEIERVAKDLLDKKKYIPKSQRGIKFL